MGRQRVRRVTSGRHLYECAQPTAYLSCTHWIYETEPVSKLLSFMKLAGITQLILLESRPTPRSLRVNRASKSVSLGIVVKRFRYGEFRTSQALGRELPTGSPGYSCRNEVRQ